MKKVIILALSLIMLFSVTACKDNSDAEIEAMKLQMQIMQQQLNDAKEAGYDPAAPKSQPTTIQVTNAPEVTAAPSTSEPEPEEGVSGDPVLALHSTIDGQTSLYIDGAIELTAVADIPEGMAVHYWEVNGEQFYEDMEDVFTFTALGATVVDARLRPEYKVTTISAEMQFLDAKGNAKGEAFTELVFEDDYVNTVTQETQPGGRVTVYVKAVVPRGYAVDYWLINDVPYYYNRTVTGFTVYDLNETTTYEVVLRAENAPASTPKPVNTPAPTEEITYYKVKCKYCTFTGGGYTKAEEGMVPAGTTIVVTANYPTEGYWEGSNPIGNRWEGSNIYSFSYKVTGDCSFTHFVIVN